MLKRLILLLLCLGVSLTFAQESTEAPVETTEEVVVTAEPTELLIPTGEAPTVEAPTSEVPSQETPTQEATVFAPSPEPALSLWASDSFEGAVSSNWILPTGWLGNGTSLSIDSANAAYFSAESFGEVAVQGQFQLVAGSTVSVFVRNGYRASLNSEGQLSLWRDETELATTTITVNPEGHFLRLSAFGDTLRVGLDGQTLLIAQDASYSAGFAGVRVDFSEAGTVTLDNFGLWIPTSLLPTVAPTDVPTRDTSSNGTGSIQVLTPPGLLQPALNAVVSKLRPTFSWQARNGATHYRLQIASNFSCSTVIAGGTPPPQTTTSFTPNFDIPQGEYWYCVEVSDDNGATWSGFAEKRRFVINVSLLPANSAVNTTNTTTNLTWTAVAGATYDLQIATDSSFAITTDINGLTTASYSLTGQAYGQYYWRVTVNGNALPQSLARSYFISPSLPVASNVSLPLNNGKYTNDTTPILNWTVPSNWATPAAGQSITYEMQLATDLNFQSQVAGSPIMGIGTNNFEWTSTNLVDGRYYWRVRARTNLGLYGAWSAAFNFRVDTVPQDAPNLNAPANGALVATARPSFTWGAVTGANRYRIEVTTDGGDFDPLIISATVSTTSFAATSSLSQGLYYWRVWSLDAAGNESLTANERNFQVDYSTRPSPNQIFVSANPRTISFRWNLVAGASGAIYTVEIDDDENFGSIDYFSPARSTNSWTSGLIPQGRWYWRLVVAGYGTSEGRAFVISPALPNAPTLINPANNSSTNDVSPSLQWNVPTLNAGNIINYSVQISTSNTFNTLVGGDILVVPTNYTISPDLPLTNGTTYYWRVRANTNLGATGAWSAARYFKLDTSAPLAPVLISPINVASVTNTLPQLKWATSAGANRYEIRYGLTADLSAVTPILVTTTTYNVASPLLLDTYYWEVRALDAAGNVGAWSGVEDFDVDSPSTAVSSPWYFVTATPTLSWTPLYWADVYQIEVSTSATFSSIAFTTTTANELTLSATTTSLASGTYYWRVRGKSPVEAGGAWGSWSATESFTIQLP